MAMASFMNLLCCLHSAIALTTAPQLSLAGGRPSADWQQGRGPDTHALVLVTKEGEVEEGREGGWREGGREDQENRGQSFGGPKTSCRGSDTGFLGVDLKMQRSENSLCSQKQKGLGPTERGSEKRGWRVKKGVSEKEAQNCKKDGPFVIRTLRVFSTMVKGFVSSHKVESQFWKLIKSRH